MFGSRALNGVLGVKHRSPEGERRRRSLVESRSTQNASRLRAVYSWSRCNIQAITMHFAATLWPWLPAPLHWIHRWLTGTQTSRKCCSWGVSSAAPGSFLFTVYFLFNTVSCCFLNVLLNTLLISKTKFVFTAAQKGRKVRSSAEKECM